MRKVQSYFACIGAICEAKSCDIIKQVTKEVSLLCGSLTAVTKITSYFCLVYKRSYKIST